MSLWRQIDIDVQIIPTLNEYKTQDWDSIDSDETHKLDKMPMVIFLPNSFLGLQQELKKCNANVYSFVC